MKKNILLAFVISAFLGLGAVVALQVDPVTELGKLRWLASGVANFVQQTNSSGQLEVRNLTSDEVAVTIDDLNGATALLRQPRLFFATATASGAGYIGYNLTDQVLCVSTGTGAGAWLTATSSNTVAEAIAITAVQAGVANRCW